MAARPQIARHKVRELTLAANEAEPTMDVGERLPLP
jgi:hypothetical protein